ncbi:unnamed protein product [Sympodiomycopsis kandeliae]
MQYDSFSSSPSSLSTIDSHTHRPRRYSFTAMHALNVVVTFLFTASIFCAAQGSHVGAVVEPGPMLSRGQVERDQVCCSTEMGQVCGYKQNGCPPGWTESNCCY